MTSLQWKSYKDVNHITVLKKNSRCSKGKIIHRCAEIRPVSLWTLCLSHAAAAAAAHEIYPFSLRLIIHVYSSIPPLIPPLPLSHTDTSLLSNSSRVQKFETKFRQAVNDITRSFVEHCQIRFHSNLWSPCQLDCMLSLRQLTKWLID